MKIKLLILILLISTFCKADQLAALTKDEALKATEYLRSQSTLILWCACCEDNSPKQIAKVSNVYYEATGIDQLYHVMLVGTDNNQKSVKEELDLAYVHINKNGMAVCLGKELGYECTPCTDPFPYYNLNIGENTQVFFEGTKEFCDSDDSWRYSVTIVGQNITLKLYPGANNNFYKNKTIAMETIHGQVQANRIITKDAPEYLMNRFRYKNGILYEINNEGGDNEYKVCQ